MKVLLSAYACIPNRGTEPGHGWGLAVNLASRGMDVHVLTSATNRELIQQHLQYNSIPGLSFHYVDPTKRFRSEEMRYLLWQFAAVRTARDLLAFDCFVMVVLITFGSVHVPTQLEISSTEVRQLIAMGRDPRFLMPDAVRKLILEANCYSKQRIT